MSEWRMGAIEMRFAQLIWDNEPISSNQLVKLAQQELGWKKSTTYTVLKRLKDRGIFCNEDAVVRALISREEFQAGQSRAFVEEAFSGSLPAFLAAFGSRKKLSQQEIDQLQDMIDSMREDK